MKALDLTGVRHDRIVGIERSKLRNNGGNVFWLVRCDCGTEFETNTGNFFNTKQCWNCAHTDIGFKVRKPNGYALITSNFCSYKRNAKQRGLCFELTRDEFETLLRGNCAYCGEIPKEKNWKKYVVTAAIHGVDRIDNKKGYTIENCATCCMSCNTAKSEMSLIEFKEWVKRVHTMLNS